MRLNQSFKICERKIDIKDETDTSICIVRDFVVSLSITDRIIPKKKNLNSIIKYLTQYIFIKYYPNHCRIHILLCFKELWAPQVLAEGEWGPPCLLCLTHPTAFMFSSKPCSHSERAGEGTDEKHIGKHYVKGKMKRVYICKALEQCLVLIPVLRSAKVMTT